MSAANPTNVEQDDEPFYRWKVLINVLATTFMAISLAVTTIVADPSIRGELALSNRKAVWITTLYLLGVNTVVPVANWFADRFGYKTMYIIGVALMSIGSLLAALAPNFAVIASARLMEGVGAGFVFPVGLALVVQNFTKELRPLALNLYMGVAFGGGLGLGLFFAGYLTQFHSWRWVFFSIFLFGTIANIFSIFFHMETEKKGKHKFDLWGYASFALFIATLLVALTYGPLPSTSEGWRSPFILGCFAFAGICLISTLLIETRSKDPLIPITLFKDPIFSVSALAMFLLGMSIFASISTTVDYMLNGLFYEKYMAAKIGMTYGLTMAFFSILSSKLLKVIPAPVLTFVGLICLISSYFLNNILDWTTGPRQIHWILLLRGMGLGLSLGPTTLQALAKVPKELSNKAAGLLTFFRQVGGTYGGTLLGILTIKRQIFHAARFGEQTNTQIPGYRETFRHLFSHFYSSVSDKGLGAAMQAKGEIIKNIETQAYIQALNDGLIVFGYVTSVVAVILLFLNLKHHFWDLRKEKSALNDQAGS